jgi:phospho-N-acetylmuramoyl-pentapeptide-transferase
MDTVISSFLSLWIGALIAFLYFNVYPARIWLGDVGSLSFGATFAVIALLLGKIVPLIIVGFPFIIEGMSSAIQLFSKKYFKKKVFPAAPLHLTLQSIGWEEPKIVFRAWLAGIILAIFGLWLGIN